MPKVEDFGTEDSGNFFDDSTEQEKTESKTTENNNSSDIINELLSDPDVLEVIRRKKSGKKVSFADQAEEAELPEPESFDSIDMESNDYKSVLREMDTRVNNKIDYNIKKNLKKIEQENEQLKNYIIENERKSQLQKARQKYSKFNDFIPRMRKLNAEKPNLTAEELYIIAKATSGKLDVNSSEGSSGSTSSERATRSVTDKKPSEFDISNKDYGHGRDAFANLLKDGLAQTKQGND